MTEESGLNGEAKPRCLRLWLETGPLQGAFLLASWPTPALPGKQRWSQQLSVRRTFVTVLELDP